MDDTPEFVVAGTYQQYRSWMRSQGLPPNKGVYVSSADKLRGVHNVNIHFIGTWQYRQDAHEIEAIARLVNVG